MLAFLIVFIAVRIEQLNNISGGSLPNTEYRNGNPAEGVAKWRSSPFINERMYLNLHFNNEKAILTEEQKIEMQNSIKKANANNDLLNFVSSFGLLQYILAPILFIYSLIMFKHHIEIKYKFIFTFPLSASVFGGFLMFHRSYFTSLGW